MEPSITKSRKPLPPEYKKIFEEAYKANRQGKGIASFLSQRMESWMHKIVAKSKFENNVILEIGAGTLNHLKYELPCCPTYDIIEPFAKLYADSPNLHEIRNIYTDISEIPFEEEDQQNQYDRIISVAVYEHVLDLDNLICKSKKLLKNDGLHIVAIPNEGHFLWKLGWTCTTGLAFRLKYGLDYSVVIDYEHVNTADEIESLLMKHYNVIKCNVLGISKKACLYRVYWCAKMN